MSSGKPRPPRPPASTSALDRVVFRPVDRSRWPDLERLFESLGAPSYCWCMVWRATPDEATRTGGPDRKAAMRSRVDGGVPIGILAYLDDQPVAWCSIAPRETYRRLGGPDDPGDAPAQIWSIVCFFVVRGLRGQGMTARLIEAAVEHARARGAKMVEAYPVDNDSPSYRFMGFVPSFRAAGFREVGRAGTRRHVMRLPVV